jgi:hypothetical protein
MSQEGRRSHELLWRRQGCWAREGCVSARFWLTNCRRSRDPSTLLFDRPRADRSGTPSHMRGRALEGVRTATWTLGCGRERETAGVGRGGVQTRVSRVEKVGQAQLASRDEGGRCPGISRVIFAASWRSWITISKS